MVAEAPTFQFYLLLSFFMNVQTEKWEASKWRISYEPLFTFLCSKLFLKHNYFTFLLYFWYTLDFYRTGWCGGDSVDLSSGGNHFKFWLPYQLSRLVLFCFFCKFF